MKLFKNYSYQKLDKDYNIVKATNEVLFYKIISIVLFVLVIITGYNASNTETVLKKVTELQTDTFERIVLVRSSNLVKLEFPRSQNIPTALNNPGAIRPGNPDVDKYAIGIVDTKSGPFLAFMNPEQGFKALKVLLNKYGNFTVKNMINKYAPSFENDTDLYISNICKNINCTPQTLVKNVNQDSLCKVISKIEGFKK